MEAGDPWRHEGNRVRGTGDIKRVQVWEIWYGASLEDAVLIKSTTNFIEAYNAFHARPKYTYIYRVEKWLWMEPK
jgi:hypothetical protein